MMQTQQQPSLDTPAEIKAPVIEHVVETARRMGDTRSGILLPVMVSYLLSTGAGILVAYLFDLAFGRDPGKGVSQTAVFLPLTVAFLLGLVLPALFAGRKRILCMLVTIILQFITLAALVFVGLSQLSLPQIAALHLS